ncbi:arylsulfatase [Phycicoccus sp. BSK3Z-2]|uniref:Arylsulfatase n=1 Tax=Phycicoccus avicenniae TaxID=2828860 RepID=A0A941HZ84_9MICO|nr:arylsulfatase [Phycicoccus avicenniae]MBR7742687.1 arylsulfatase [Phycicoccus avicenniae]
MTDRPNVLLVLADDLGYSDIGCYGGEIETPNLDRLGRAGVRCSSFYNTARCSPSRASLLTGRDPHETGIGILTENDAPTGYPGTMSREWPTLAEHFKDAGYATCLSGKWHLSNDVKEANDSWPTRRGFDEFYGILMGADHYFHPVGLFHNEEKLPSPEEPGYYFTDAVSDHASEWVAGRDEDDPFFLYLAYTAPHWPLHASPEDMERYDGVYEEGWDALRAARLERLREEGLLGESARLSERDLSQPAWDEVTETSWEASRMAAYAAMVTAMDRGIGRILDTLEARGELENTIVVFLADNGGCAEIPGGAAKFRARNRVEMPDGRPVRVENTPDVPPGGPDTWCAYGPAWANLSNSPFRLYKRWTHEGGIASPFVVHWPAGGLAEGAVVDTPFQLTDVMPTFLEAAGLPRNDGRGSSMLETLRGGEGPAAHTLYWEHIGNCAVREGDWKLVREAERPWELYDLGTDRSELDDLAPAHPERVEAMAAAWQEWADGVGVLPWPAYQAPWDPETDRHQHAQ